MRRITVPGVPVMLAALAMLALPSAAGAQSLPAMVAAAVQADPGVAIASSALERRLIQGQNDAAEPFFSIEVGSGAITYSSADDPRPGEPAQAVQIAPSVAVTLATPLGTTVAASLPATVDLGSGDWNEVAPTVSVTQPLNDLLGLVDDTTADLEELYDITDAELDLAAAVRDVEAELLAALRNVVELQSQCDEARLDLAEAEAALQEAQELNTYREDSSQYARLVTAVDTTTRQLAYLAASETLARQSLQRVAGRQVTDLPSALPTVALALPGVADVGRNPAALLAGIDLALQRAELNDHRGSALPALSLTGAYRRTFDDVGANQVVTTNASAALEAAFDELSISLGAGGIADTDTLYVSAELTWSPSNRAADTFTEQLLTADLRIAEQAWQQAYQNFLDDRSQLALELEDLQRRGLDLEMDRSTAELALAETEARHQRGLADDEELARAQWTLETVDWGSRAIVFAEDDEIPEPELRGCIALALTYHLWKTTKPAAKRASG